MRLMITTVDGPDRREHVVEVADGSTVGDLVAVVDRADPGTPRTAGQPASAGQPGSAGRSGPASPPGIAGQPGSAGMAGFLDAVRGVGPAGPPARPVFLDADPLDPASPVQGSGIRSGSRLGLGAPPADADQVRRGSPPPDEPILAEVHLVSGPGAGQCWRLTAGSYEIGHDHRCALQIPVPESPSGGLWLTIGTDGSAYWHRSAETGGKVRPSTVIAPPQVNPLTGLPVGEVDPDEEDPGEPIGADPLPVAPATPVRAETTHLPDGATAWPLDEDLAVGQVLLRVTAQVEPDAAVTTSADGIGLDYNRPPRIAPHLDSDRVRLPTPPSPVPGPRFPLLVMVAPVILGLALVWAFNSYFYLIFLIMSPMLAIGNWVAGRRNNRKRAAEARRRYGIRLRRMYRDLHLAVGYERWVRNQTGPDPATLALIATGPGSRLWERRRRDPDHLLLRLGTVDLPSVKAVDDPARDDGREVRWNIPDVSIALEIPEYGVVGVAGRAGPVLALARWLVVQAAVLHSPRDVRIVVLTDAARADLWSWVRWLPHLAPQAARDPLVSVGNDPESVANRITELVAQIEARNRVLGSSMARAMFTDPDVLVVVDGARRLRDVPGLVRVLAEGPRVRVFSVCLDEQERLLPEECAAVVVADGAELTLRRTGLRDVPAIRADQVGFGVCDQIARALAPLRDVSPQSDSGLPDRVRLLELIDLEPPDPAVLVNRWRRRPASTSFVLGVGYDGPLVLDLVRDGPHGLVAGTTGSGKSELLQSFVAALAAGNRPDELTFVLVDYKGGSAFRECAALPHTLGMVTDLDAHLVQRALDSLAAELRRRERILAGAEAKDHPAYRSKRLLDPELPPLPRLVLVIDEFATLVREMPDFVAGLISIAQRGRSLGIHLVLATQRPAGAVTADVRANTNLRIALRVTDNAESYDVIESNEASLISPSTPGRALVRAGHGAPVPFQSAWVGAARPDKGLPPGARPSSGTGPSSGAGLSPGAGSSPDPRRGSRGTVRSVELPVTRLGRPLALPVVEQPVETPTAAVPTDLEALVAAVRRATELLDDFTPQPSPWLDALAESIVLDDLPPVRREPPVRGAPPVIPYALEDVPKLQERRVAAINLATFGHLYIVGSPRSGRTQALRTIAGSVASSTDPRDVHLYGIDAGGGGLAAIDSLPQCGAVVPRHDVERLERLLRRLGQELTARQEAFVEHNCAGLVELRGLLPAARRPPHILVLVDGWDALSPLLDEHDNGRLVGEVLRLLREGAGAGIHLVATSERSLIGGRLGAYNDNKLLLRQSDRSDYQLVGMMPSKAPTHVPPGRGWHLLSRTETQIALLAPDPAGQEQTDALRRIGTRARRREKPGTDPSPAQRPFPVALLPNRIEFTDAFGKVAESSRRPLWALLGVGGDDASAIGVDLAGSASSFLIAGPAGSGRSNVLACVAVSLLAGGTSLVVLTPRESPLRSLARHPQVRVLAEPDPAAETVRAALDSFSGPRALLVDDAELLATAAADRVLRDVAIAGRDQGIGLVFAGLADSLTTAMSSWLTPAKRSRRGVVLSPRNLPEGDMIGVRLPVNLLRVLPPQGRGWTTGPNGTAVAVQVPLTTLRQD